jgi:hypothetical protein
MLTTTDPLMMCCTALCRRAAIASRAEAQRQLAAEKQRNSALESARRRSAECRHTLLQQQSQAERELAATLQGFAGDASDIDNVYESDCDAAAVQDDIESNHSYYEEEAQQLKHGDAPAVESHSYDARAQLLSRLQHATVSLIGRSTGTAAAALTAVALGSARYTDTSVYSEQQQMQYQHQSNSSIAARGTAASEAADQHEHSDNDSDIGENDALHAKLDFSMHSQEPVAAV